MGAAEATALSTVRPAAAGVSAIEEVRSAAKNVRILRHEILGRRTPIPVSQYLTP
jgi:hypothetical protein